MNHLWWVALDVVLALAIGATVAFGGGRVVVACFRRVDAHGVRARLVESEDAAGAAETGKVSDPGKVVEAARALPGGAWIGVLERIAVYAALLAGWKEALAVVLAVKGLARYPELRAGDTPAVAERFIIGTFISVLLACAAGATTLWLWSLTP